MVSKGNDGSFGFRLFSDSPEGAGGRIAVLYAVLAAANVLAWVWALIAFRDYPLQLGTAFLAYTFGLRHAVDADHIAAIDNVTRKLMQEGKRPVGVGFFFSLGHSTVVCRVVRRHRSRDGGVPGQVRCFQSYRRRRGNIGVRILSVRHRDHEHLHPRLGL